MRPDRDLAADRRRADDGAALSVNHLGPKSLKRVENADEVHVEDRLKICDVHRCTWGVVNDPGVCDDDIRGFGCGQFCAGVCVRDI